MIHAVTQGQHRKDHQGADLDYVNGHVDRRRAVHAAVGDVGHPEGEHHGHCHHEHGSGVGSAHERRPDGPREVAHQNSHDSDHHARIQPVIKVRAPADDELRQARKRPGFLVVQKRLLRKIVRTSRAGIKFCHLRVTHCRGKAEQQREEDTRPHGRRGGAGRALGDERQPKKGPGGDERHRVHRQARQT